MEPKKVVEAWVEAFNKADAALISDFYTDDAINHQIANREIVGKDAIRSMFQEEFEAADMVCIVENIFQDGEDIWGQSKNSHLISKTFPNGGFEFLL